MRYTSWLLTVLMMIISRSWPWNFSTEPTDMFSYFFCLLSIAVVRRCNFSNSPRILVTYKNIEINTSIGLVVGSEFWSRWRKVIKEWRWYSSMFSGHFSIIARLLIVAWVISRFKNWRLRLHTTIIISCLGLVRTYGQCKAAHSNAIVERAEGQIVWILFKLGWAEQALVWKLMVLIWDVGPQTISLLNSAHITN